LTRGGYICTFTGGRFYPLDPRPEEVRIEDIAHALSMVCRFTGHSRDFYSVAQHCYLASHLVPEQDALAALLHDAAEAYICDVSSPVKHAPEFEFYRAAEDRLLRVIFERFGLDPGLPESVHHVDGLLVVTEARSLLHNPFQWDGKIGYDVQIRGLAPADAERLYLRRFKELYR
jgi:hypothetical protein